MVNTAEVAKSAVDVASVMTEEVAAREPTFASEKVAPLMFDVHGVWETPPIHVPLIAKHPVLPAAVMMLMEPPWKVDVAVLEENIDPTIERSWPGVEVPIPKLPNTVSLSPTLSIVVDAFVPVALVKKRLVAVMAVLDA